MHFATSSDKQGMLVNIPKKITLKVSKKIDQLLDRIPQNIRKMSTKLAGKTIVGLTYGIIFLYARTNSKRSFIADY